MAPQRLEKIESAPGNGRGSEASNLQHLVHGRTARKSSRKTILDLGKLPQLHNFATLSFSRLLSGRPARSASRRCTRSCRFEGSEPLPFPGADSIFSSRCGAISRRLRFQIPNGCRLQIASPILSSKSPRKGRDHPRASGGRPEELKKDCSTNSASPKQNAQKSTPPVSAENRAQARRPARWSPRRPLGVAFGAGPRRSIRMKGRRTNKPYHIF
jgi:hypothetical protein